TTQYGTRYNHNPVWYSGITPYGTSLRYNPVWYFLKDNPYGTSSRYNPVWYFLKVQPSMVLGITITPYGTKYKVQPSMVLGITITPYGTRYNPIWYFLKVTPYGTSLRYNPVWYFLRYKPVWYFLKVQPSMVLGITITPYGTRYNPVWYFLRYNPMWYFLRYNPVWYFLRYNPVWYFLKVQPRMVLGITITLYGTLGITPYGLQMRYDDKSLFPKSILEMEAKMKAAHALGLRASRAASKRTDGQPSRAGNHGARKYTMSWNKVLMKRGSQGVTKDE
ncbi:predicted protein, partial [Nematostella vectensis]